MLHPLHLLPQEPTSGSGHFSQHALTAPSAAASWASKVGHWCVPCMVHVDCCISQILAGGQSITLCFCIQNADAKWKKLCIMLWSWFSKLIYSANTFLDVALPWSLTISICCPIRSKVGNSFTGCHTTSMLGHCYAVEFQFSHHNANLYGISCGFLCRRMLREGDSVQEHIHKLIQWAGTHCSSDEEEDRVVYLLANLP